MDFIFIRLSVAHEMFEIKALFNQRFCSKLKKKKKHAETHTQYKPTAVRIRNISQSFYIFSFVDAPSAHNETNETICGTKKGTILTNPKHFTRSHEG